MSDFVSEIIPISLEEELQNSYLDYAMSVIIGRALPDVRDGLKPVHRRVLFAMHELSNDSNKPYKKSARIVGDVIGKYHPHGENAAYDTIVRMAQHFSLRYMLVDGQGNFGSVDGDSAAAMRYTEVRMSKIAHELLIDLEKDTVDFLPNYDGKEFIPAVLPTKIPNLLVNGSSGIAVGMATNIPPHNLTEVIDAALAYLHNEEITIEGLMQYLPGPDFPTAAIINGNQGILNAYRTGRGKLILRARARIEKDEKSGRETIIVYELPYQVNKAKLIEKIALLVKEKRIEQISALRDESDKDGMRVVIELKRDAIGEVVLNNLYEMTSLQTSFGINMVALHEGKPKILNLKQILQAFITHRREIVTRRTLFELRKAQDRAHILAGLAVALENIDAIIALIRHSSTAEEAKKGLINTDWRVGDVATMLQRITPQSELNINLPSTSISVDKYRFSESQAQAILDLRLQKLTGLEYTKLQNEYYKLAEEIVQLTHILSHSEKLTDVITTEFQHIKEKYGDARRTEIIAEASIIDPTDLITREDVVVTLSYKGYVKYQPLTDYEAQRRGGKGKSATNTKNEDFITNLLVANTHDTILCFSSRGRLYWLKVFDLSKASRIARGQPIVNLLNLTLNERITAILPVTSYDSGINVFMSTANGVVKKTQLIEFSRPRNTGIIAINLNDGDELIGVDVTNGNDEVMLFSAQGKVVRFSEQAVRPTNRNTQGVRGIKLQQNDKVVSLIIPRCEQEILTVTENGFGKRTAIKAYPAKSRATMGVVSIKVSERNGKVIGAIPVTVSDQIMLITDGGTLVRTRVAEVSLISRNTQGVRLIRIAEQEHLVGIQRVVEPEESEESEESGFNITTE